MTLVGTLVCLGQKPRCVLEIQERGQGRLARLYELIRSCAVSIHDLSRTGSPVRFNMPFELGLACGIALSGADHEIVVFDRKDYRLDVVLSDYKGRDPLIHYNRCDRLIARLLDLYRVPDEPSPSAIRSAAKLIRSSARDIAHQYKSDTIFHPAPFRALIAAATEVAVARGFIRP